ncbi:unnamed protein product [Musa hybrid cultivar]
MPLRTSCCLMIHWPSGVLSLCFSNLWPQAWSCLIPWNDQLLRRGQDSSRRPNPPPPFRPSLLLKATQHLSTAPHGVWLVRGFHSWTSRTHLIGPVDSVALTAPSSSPAPPATTRTHSSPMPPTYSTATISRTATPISRATSVELQPSSEEIQVMGPASFSVQSEYCFPNGLISELCNRTEQASFVHAGRPLLRHCFRGASS